MRYSVFRSIFTIPYIALAAVIAMTGCDDKKQSAYQGYVEGEFVYVASSEPGRLNRLAVSRGQRISSGSLLFSLESETEEAAKRQAQQQLMAAEAQLRNIQTGNRPKEIEVVHAQLAQAVALEKKSAAKRIRDESLYRTESISKAQLDDTRAEAESNIARVRELKNQLDVAHLPARDEQIRAQSANVEAVRAALDQTEWKLNQKTVTSSRSGLIFDTLYQEGEWVQAGSPVIRMLPQENIKVRFFVPETLIGILSIGRNVVFRYDGCPADISAKVSYISTEAEYTPPIIYSNETRSKLTYMVEAHPLDSDVSALHPGQPVGVSLR